MPVPISPDHPIRGLFYSIVERALRRQGRPHDAYVARYLANVLVDFIHRDNVFRIRDARGRRLEEIAEMLLEGDVSLRADGFDREREVHKHIGDFALFWTGVYPEMLRYLRASSRPDHLIDYIEQGRASYRIAATFRHGAYANEAPILGQLSDQFELFMFGLNQVRRELDAYSDPRTRAALKLLES